MSEGAFVCLACVMAIDPPAPSRPSVDVTETSPATEQRLRFAFEGAMAENQERLSRILDTVPDGIMILPVSGRIEFANPAAERILGLTRSEVEGRAYQDPAWKITALDGGPFPDSDLPFARVLATGEAVSQVEHAIETPQGRRTLLSINAAPLRDSNGTLTGVVVAFTDITARKQADVALRESEERLRLFIQHAPAALAMFDRDMRYIEVSRRWRNDYGLGDRPLRGRSHYEVFPEIGAEWKAVHQRGLAGEVVRAEEDRFVRADGTEQWLRWEVRPWHDARGGIGGIVVFSEDVTAKVTAERTLKQQLAELRRWHDATLGRETRVVELKAEINRLLVAAGQPPRYASAAEPAHAGGGGT